MNPAFILIVLILAVVVWFLLAPWFKEIGNHARNFQRDVNEATIWNEDDDEMEAEAKENYDYLNK